MLFNTLQYFLFLPLVFVLFYSISGKYRWTVLLAASYYFYMCWEINYIFLLFTSTTIDFFCAKKIESSKTKRLKKIWMFGSILSNLSILFFFKYFNFFTDTIQLSLGVFNIQTVFPDFHILLPVGISFYTFQSLSYTIDVYRGSMPAEKHFGYFALFVSFFPQLVAGPIERACHLIPRLKAVNPFNYQLAVSGTKLIALGLFKKAVIADRLSPYVSLVFDHPENLEGFPVIIGTVFFAFQIYCDFSGYSDIAIGSARVLGVNMMKNFNLPYFSSGFGEFWKRWHISLSTWFKDYVYIPLGGNKVGKARRHFNLIFTFFVSGLWHGANFTFIIWGIYNGVLITIESLVSKYFKVNSKLIKIPFVFFFILIGWIFFRASSIENAWIIIQQACRVDIHQLGIYMFKSESNPIELYLSFLGIFSLLFFETCQFNIDGFNSKISRINNYIKWPLYIVIVLTILMIGIFERDQFIYFQF